jgi:prepilin-type N-terminal cleavage/methylation domain-containing protein
LRIPETEVIVIIELLHRRRQLGILQMSKIDNRSRRGIGAPDYNPPNGAFTLVELLVVMAVLALLAALIIPSLSDAREHQYDVSCKSNLRQLMPGLLMGVNDTGRIPARNDPELTDSLRCPKGYFENGGGQALNVDGSITEVRPRPSTVVPNGAQESNSEIFGFMEQEGYILPTALSVDITEPGGYGRSQASYGSTSGTIPAGTAVDCFFLTYDPSSSGSITDGSVTLSSPIIGVIVQTNTLDRTDSIIGRTDMTYPVNQSARGFESNAEEIELSDDMMTLRIVNFSASFPGEHVRIITEAGGMGSGSYGVNGMFDPIRTRPDQILMSEYGSSIIYPTSTQHEDTLDRLCDEDRLHFGRLNVGQVNGTVISLHPRELEADSKRWYPDP